ncbi:MAG: cell division protein FtsA, partial [Sulfurimonas sp.]|nr:cell division protein FtsA [Sulfurimonas sp.]
ITNDLSMALHTPLNVADNVKIDFGSLLSPNNDLIELPLIGDDNNTHEVSLEVVYNVIYARVEETLMILAQYIENSGLKDKLGAGIVLTGGLSKMPGIRELAVATFDSGPVRLAKPKVMEGLFNDLKGPEFASAVGIVMYSSSNYTPYEIDVNKHVRHSSEIPLQNSVVDFSSEPEIPIAPSSTEDVAEKLVILPSKKEKKNDKASSVSKFWNWATQLF